MCEMVTMMIVMIKFTMIRSLYQQTRTFMLSLVYFLVECLCDALVGVCVCMCVHPCDKSIIAFRQNNYN